MTGRAAPFLFYFLRTEQTAGRENYEDSPKFMDPSNRQSHVATRLQTDKMSPTRDDVVTGRAAGTCTKFSG